jgi:hypothetical protein
MAFDAKSRLLGSRHRNDGHGGFGEYNGRDGRFWSDGSPGFARVLTLSRVGTSAGER